MKRDQQEEWLNKWNSQLEEALDQLRPLYQAWQYYDALYQGVNRDVEARLATNMQMRDYATLNVVFWMVESITPLLSEAAPAWYVKSLGAGGEEVDDVLTTALQAIAQRSGFSTQYKAVLRDQLIRGTGFMRALWNNEAGERRPYLGPNDRLELRPIGDVEVRWVDPFAVVPDPAARSLAEAEWVAIRSDVSAERAKRLWPAFDVEQAERLMPEGQDFAEGASLRRAMLWLQRLFGRIESPRGAAPLYRIWELYHEGGARLSIFSGRQLLWDGANPLPSGRYPLVAFRMCPRGDSFWGMPLTAQIEGLQRHITAIYSRLHQHVRLLGSPPIVTNDPTVAQQLANRTPHLPGAVLQVAGPDRYVRYMEVPPVPNWAWQMLLNDIENVKAIAGIADVLRGVRPGSIQSGVAIQALQESAMSRIRDMGTDNAYALQVLGQLVIEHMQAFYDEARQYVFQRGGSIRTVTLRPEMLRLGLAGEPWELSGESAEEPRSLWVVVEPGASLPLSAAARAELALRLFQLRDEFGLPVIDDEALLDAVCFPRRKDVLERKQRLIQGMVQGQAAQQAAAQGAAPPGAAGMPPEVAMQLLQGLAQGQAPEPSPEALGLSPDEVAELKRRLQTES